MNEWSGPGSWTPEVFLLSDQIRLRQPSTKFGVDIRGLYQSKYMHMVPRRNCLDVAKARMVQSARQYQVPVEPGSPRRQLRKRHSDLKRDSCLFWKDTHGADRLQDCNDLIEQRANLRRLVAEVIGKLVFAAGMRLIAVGEVPTALVAMPQSRLFHRQVSAAAVVCLTLELSGAAPRQWQRSLERRVRHQAPNSCASCMQVLRHTCVARTAVRATETIPPRRVAIVHFLPGLPMPRAYAT